MSILQYDVVIVGGGVVGAGLALALQPTGYKVALLDVKPAAYAQDPRLFALNHSSCQFLINLGLWPSLAEYAAPIEQVHVSHQGKLGTVCLHAAEVGLQSLGHVIPAWALETALYEKLQLQAYVTIMRPAVLQSLTHSPQGALLRCKTEQGEKVVQASFVTAADGTNSWVRKLLQIDAEIHDYQQSAIVTTTALKRHHQQMAYERFNAQGAIAMLPLVGNQCATIWTSENKTVAQLMAMTDVQFLQQLQQEFGYRLGRLSHIGKRHVFPLRQVRAKKSAEHAVYLLGNAAHTLHPIASQGLNLALYETTVLAERMIEITSRETGPLALTSVDLEHIHASVQKQRAISITASHRLATLFAGRPPFFNAALSLGMLGLDLGGPLKKRFIHGLIGRAGQSPRLLLGNMP